jgi:hypothetical protein
MILLFTGALVVAGLFTLVPGRIMHQVFFGAWRAVAGGAFQRRRRWWREARKSLEKQTEKPLPKGSQGWLSGPRCAI